MNDKGINNLSLQTRIEELNDFALLHKKFGNIAFRAIQKNNSYSGFAVGMERLTKLTKAGKFDIEAFRQNPVEGVREFLQGYFADRGGNMPDIWAEGNTVFLETKFCKNCLTIEAEKLAEQCHEDICAIYCRTFAKGIVSVLEDFFPEIVINFYNVSSRRDGKESDCREAFQVLSPKRVKNPS
ncbi:MAG: hypothetical protein K9N09_07455 [Candidatus Cloacimonetes bacterium]|nr:hypothetical protein [Candidatus Cloacimonadota bacterium]MCF7813921.1 hypothetical protein [Candidatus Cloacimonadota bacterium]MCF7868518.1 hypothetical protein [Candidatus Cloacimonadota bacterium]MCF7884033.1 hypothetical protein [Candidatus Cloacimonadota bacterium]